MLRQLTGQTSSEAVALRNQARQTLAQLARSQPRFRRAPAPLANRAGDWLK